MPSDIAEAFSAGYPVGYPSHKLPTPIEGCNFVCVYLTITRIENVHMVEPIRYGNECSVLLDAESHEYAPVWFQVPVLLVDPEHFATSPTEVAESAKGFLVFAVPKHEKPAKLSFVYSFKKIDMGREICKEGSNRPHSCRIC